jgi:hypothetical protein
MASMFIKQRVADYAKWKAVFDEHETMRRAGGVTAHSVQRQPDDPNVVIVALRVSDMGKAKQFAGSDDLKAAMARAGVQGTPEIWIADEVEEKRYP